MRNRSTRYVYSGYRIYRKLWAKRRAAAFIRETGVPARVVRRGHWWEVYVPAGMKDRAWEIWRTEREEREAFDPW